MIPYDRRKQVEEKCVVREKFEGDGSKIANLLAEMLASDDFYFDKLCQIHMDAWTKGRVALVGDSAYCSSPAAGMGGSVAILGTAALGETFRKHPDDFHAAFRS